MKEEQEEGERERGCARMGRDRERRGWTDRAVREGERGTREERGGRGKREGDEGGEVGARLEREREG